MNYTSRIIPYRTFKNFGHKREPVPPITFLWHGFLTFSFIGMGLEWKRVAKFFFGDNDNSLVSTDLDGEEIYSSLNGSIFILDVSGVLEWEEEKP